MTTETISETKTCYGCVNLVINENAGALEENGGLCKCDKYLTEGMDSPMSFDSLEECEAKSDCDGCLNWEAKQPENVLEIDESIIADLDPSTPENKAIIDEIKNDSKSTEPTEEELIAADSRRDSRIKEINHEMHAMEDLQIAARREANSYKKPLADMRVKLDRLIFADARSFLEMEREEKAANSRPLLDAADEAEKRANAWRNEPVDKLDVTEKDREKLLACFSTCGEVADWIGKEWPEKKPGLGGEKTKDRIRSAIEKISGSDAIVAAELAKAKGIPNEEEQPVAAERPENNDWADLNASEYFDLTKKEWDAIKKEFCTEDVLVGDLSSLQEGISSGAFKIKGLGDKFAKKLEDQFTDFWARIDESKAASDVLGAVDHDEFFEGMAATEDGGFCSKIEEMLESGNYEFARDTLEGMMDWADANNHITPKMIIAANNIFNAADGEYEPEDWEGE